MLHIYRQISAIKRFRVTVFAQKRENEVEFPFQDVVVVPKGPWRWLRRIVERQILGRPLFLSRGETRRLRTQLDANRCSLLHVFFGNAAVQLLPLLADQTRLWPTVVSFHGADVLVELDDPHYRRAFLDMIGRVDLVLARSKSLIDALARVGCPPEKIRLNRTGIPLSKFPFQARVWPTDGRWRLLQACRLVEKKGLPTTLRAFACFAGTYPLATLTIAGEGSQKPGLQQLCAELGISDKVRFTGFLSQDELRTNLYGAHFFLHPSEQAADGNQEGVPNSTARSDGDRRADVLPPRHGGIPEAVEHGVERLARGGGRPRRARAGAARRWRPLPLG